MSIILQNKVRGTLAHSFKTIVSPSCFGKTRLANTFLSLLEAPTPQVLGALLNEDFMNPDPPGMERFLETAEGNWRRGKDTEAEVLICLNDLYR